jgi:hypothetical protein
MRRMGVKSFTRFIKSGKTFTVSDKEPESGLVELWDEELGVKISNPELDKYLYDLLIESAEKAIAEAPLHRRLYYRFKTLLRKIFNNG